MNMMRKMRRIAAILLAMAMVIAMGATALAQNVDSNKGGSATITISNAAKGETYKVFKLFDAKVDENGAIVYTGTIPSQLTAYFVTNESGNIIMANGAAELSADALAAMKDWAATHTPAARADSEGGALTFSGLEYGYYVITSSQGNGNAITVDSTNPNATVEDKNSTEPSITKSVNDDNVAIGQTVTYTVTAHTANYLASGTDSRKVVRYDILDTLPDFLSDVTVTNIKIDGTDYTVNGAVPQFDSEKKITINWTDAAGTHLYANGASITITYTAVVTDKAVVDGEGNKNIVTLKPYVGDTPDNPQPWEKEWNDDQVIYTYAVALKKIDEDGKPLAGATFYVQGLKVTGDNGEYTAVSYNPTSTEYDVMKTDERGYLIVKGIPSDIFLTVYEDEAPAGYNKMTGGKEWKPVVINKTVTTSQGKIYYDADGNVTNTETSTFINVVNFNEEIVPLALEIENKKGIELPSTGGIGTTIFYVVGSILMAAAAIILITRRRVKNS